MKVKVIEDKCIGCGQCEAVCPDVFQIGDEGFAEVITNEYKEEIIDDIEMAASGCPTDAIEVNKNCDCSEVDHEDCDDKNCKCHHEDCCCEDDCNCNEDCDCNK